MKIKPGVRAHRTWAIPVAIMVSKDIVEGLGVEFVITSGIEGVHGVNSLHYSGYAFDFRTRDLPGYLRPTCERMLQEALGDEYDVIYEAKKSHMHVEYHPDHGGV